MLDWALLSLNIALVSNQVAEKTQKSKIIKSFFLCGTVGLILRA